MPFDPRIIPADDAPLDDRGQLLLPDDLSELAAQLSDDAQHLALLYPAPVTAKIAVGNRAEKVLGATRRIIFAALLLVAVAGGSWLGMQPAQISPGRAVPAPHNLVAENVASETINESVSSLDAVEQPTSPVFLLYEYSGPELEGVYDLLAESPSEEISF